MAEKGAESKDSLIIDYEAQLQSLIMWGGDSIPALKDYLDELNISLSPRDDRLIELIKVDIQRRASLTETPESTVLESVLRQFPDLTESQFCELALCEWQVWARRSPRLNTVQYAEQLRQLNRVSHAKLLALLTTHDELCGSASSRSDMFDCDRLEGFLPGDQIDSFEIVERPGGGMGIVFKARQLQPFSRDVALKIIRSEQPTREILARFDVETIGRFNRSSKHREDL